MKKPSNPAKGRGKLLIRIGVALLIMALFAGSVAAALYYRKQYQQLDRMTAEQFSVRDNARVIKSVGKLYSLPKGEDPSIATIKDKDAVKKQYPFLEQAENGDALLLYQKAQLAILYRPSTKQLVKVGALNVQNSATATIKVIGTATARAAVLKTLGDNKVTATDAGDAKTTHTGVTIVDVSGKNSTAANQLATLLKGQVGSLPAGEDAPASGTDLLIVAGDATNP